MAYCELLLQNSLSLLEIDANLAIIYLLTNFYFKKIATIIAFFTFNHYIFKYFRQFQEIDFCETCISQTSLREVNQCEI